MITKVNMVDISPGTKTNNFSFHAVFGHSISGFDTDCINIDGDITDITYTITSISPSNNLYSVDFILPENVYGNFTISPSATIQVICDMETTANIKFKPIQIVYDTRRNTSVIM